MTCIHDEFLSSFNIKERQESFQQTVEYYCQKWCSIESDPNTICSVCSVLLEGRTRDRHKKVHVFASHAPISLSGIIIVWYYFKSTFNLSESTALNVSPKSILFHFLLKCCQNDMEDVNTIAVNIPNIIESLSLYTRTSTSKEKSQLLSYIKIMVRDLSHGGCQGYVEPYRCIFSNTGAVKANSLARKLDVDMRHVMDPDYITSTLHKRLTDFIADDEYVQLQPGITVDKRFATDSEKTKKTCSGLIRSLEDFEDNLFEVCTVDTDQLIKTRHASIVQSIESELDFLHNLHSTVSRYCTGTFRDIIMGTRKEECLFCTLSVSPSYRRIIHDIINMIQEKKIKAGLGKKTDYGQLLTGSDSSTVVISYGTAEEREDESKHGEKTNYIKKRKCRRQPNMSKKQKLSTDLYTYGFNNTLVTSEGIQACYEEWVSDRYPFLSKWFLSRNISQTDVENFLVNHNGVAGNIYCICNIRKMFTDCDIFSTPNGLCFLPLLVTLCNDLPISNTLKTKIKFCVAQHHIFTVNTIRKSFMYPIENQGGTDTSI